MDICMINKSYLEKSKNLNVSYYSWDHHYQTKNLTSNFNSKDDSNSMTNLTCNDLFPLDNINNGHVFPIKKQTLPSISSLQLDISKDDSNTMTNLTSNDLPPLDYINNGYAFPIKSQILPPSTSLHCNSYTSSWNQSNGSERCSFCRDYQMNYAKIQQIQPYDGNSYKQTRHCENYSQYLHPFRTNIINTKLVNVKRKRKRANKFQLEVLNNALNQNYFPTTSERLMLSEELGMTPRTVQIWFQNNRSKLRSKSKVANHELINDKGNYILKYYKSIS